MGRREGLAWNDKSKWPDCLGNTSNFTPSWDLAKTSAKGLFTKAYTRQDRTRQKGKGEKSSQVWKLQSGQARDNELDSEIFVTAGGEES